MSQLDRVTITGADDSVTPQALATLSQCYPFVEWGILISASRAGSPRYPSAGWFGKLQEMANLYQELGHIPLKLSLHVCGSMVRSLLLGKNVIPADMLAPFARVQLNFHAERSPCYTGPFCEAMRSLGPKQFIFQVDGATGNQHFEHARYSNGGRQQDLVPLFDVSGGAGVLPSSWPQAVYTRGANTIYHGYAGGLGPHNLVEQIPVIAMAAGSRHWIDMETHVRSDDDQRFDLDKVAQALRICNGFIHKADPTEKRA